MGNPHKGKSLKILIVGSGGREYSIALSLKNDSRIKQIYFSSGNGASANLGINIYAKSNAEIVDFCVNNDIALVVIGPEQPLIDGLSDDLRAANIRVFAPSRAAAQLEGSKIFMKNLLAKYQIPTAKFIASGDKNTLFDFIDSTSFDKIVIKADGLCGGKGVLIVDSKQSAKDSIASMLSGESFGNAGKKVVVEEFLDGFELSVFAICDGENFIVLPTAQDHKRLLDNDLGVNTGGMGAYSPTPQCDEILLKKVESRIIKPTLDAMKSENAEFCGVLFCGIMVVNGEPFVLEFNVRFGDPECEVILPLLKTPLLDIMNATIDKKLADFTLEILPKSCVGVVIASENYPDTSPPQKISMQTDLNYTDNSQSHISFAGVSERENALFATGGRVLVCVGIGDCLKEAQENAYNLTQKISFYGAKMRKDIANKAFAFLK